MDFLEYLLKNGVIVQGTYLTVSNLHANSKEEYIDILLSQRGIDNEKIYSELSKFLKLRRLDLKECNFKYSNKLSMETAIKNNIVVIGKESNKYKVAVTRKVNEDEISNVENELGADIVKYLATKQEMEYLIYHIYKDEIVDISTEKLARECPEISSKVVFTKKQMIVICSILIMIIISFFINWYITLNTLIILMLISYLILTVFQCFIIKKGLHQRRVLNKDNISKEIKINKDEIDNIDENELPIYTILVPMYKESEVVKSLVEHMEELDYPKWKLDVRLLIEEDDIETQDEIKKMNLPEYYTTLVIPDSMPKTKPKACNYGMLNARGEFVVIFDAEDRVEPDQLKKVYLAFKKLPKKYVCMQCKLNYFNAMQNWITKFFTNEYSVLFEIILPGMMCMDMPIPLGGTSNHFRTDILKKVFSWDPYNVTEDADLGLRIYTSNLKIGIVDSITWEEGNSQLYNWIRQRSRWIKGYMQTWLVNMRNPIKLLKNIGLKGVLGFHGIILGRTFTSLFYPIGWLILLIWYMSKKGWINSLTPIWINYSVLVSYILIHLFFMISNISSMKKIYREKEEKISRYIEKGVIKYIYLIPIYWFMMSIAGYKALWQLITRPFYWEKTKHGLNNK